MRSKCHRCRRIPIPGYIHCRRHKPHFTEEWFAEEMGRPQTLSEFADCGDHIEPMVGGVFMSNPLFYLLMEAK